MNKEQLIENAVNAAWDKRRKGISGQVVVSPPQEMYDMIRAALAVFEEAHTPTPKCGGAQTNCRHDMHPPMHSAACPVSQAHIPTDDERERIEQSNEVAGIVFDQVKKAWPDLHPVLDLRYGIADALWDAGFRRTVQSEPTAPDGWFPFGSHAPYPWTGRLEFSTETDEGGMPLWERPIQ